MEQKNVIKYCTNSNDNDNTLVQDQFKLFILPKKDKLPLDYSIDKFKSINWLIFTKKGCGYCTKAKNLLKEHNIVFTETEIDSENSYTIYAQIDKYTNKYRYFPIIFNNGKFIGGYSELEKLNLNDKIIECYSKNDIDTIFSVTENTYGNNGPTYYKLPYSDTFVTINISILENNTVFYAQPLGEKLVDSHNNGKLVNIYKLTPLSIDIMSDPKNLENIQKFLVT